MDRLGSGYYSSQLECLAIRETYVAIWPCVGDRRKEKWRGLFMFTFWMQ